VAHGSSVTAIPPAKDTAKTAIVQQAQGRTGDAEAKTGTGYTFACEILIDFNHSIYLRIFSTGLLPVHHQSNRKRAAKNAIYSPSSRHENDKNPLPIKGGD
jgi:hypothetical protein